MSAVVSDATHAPLSDSVSWQLHFSPQRGATIVSVDVNAPRFRVGRRGGLNLTLPSPQISGLHAEFVAVGIRLFVRDLGSTNGTYVNGKRIDHRDHPLRHGDRVRMADRELIVCRCRIPAATTDTAVAEGTAIGVARAESHSNETPPTNR